MAPAKIDGRIRQGGSSNGVPFKTPFCSIGIPNQGIYLLHLPGDLDTGKMEPL